MILFYIGMTYAMVINDMAYSSHLIAFLKILLSVEPVR